MPQNLCNPELLFVVCTRIGGVLISLALGIHCGWAGELRVERRKEAVIVEAEQVPVSQVLATLQESFNLQYRLPSSMDRVISGRHEGSLQRVIASILQGTDYILRSTPDGAVLTIIERIPEVPKRGPSVEFQSSPSTDVERVPRIAPQGRGTPRTFPGEGMTYPAGTDFGKGL
jgi:hypothetical protein